MNCKLLYQGPTSLGHLRGVTKKVLYAIAATIFDNYTGLSIRTRIALLHPDYFVVADVCRRLNIDSVEVTEQYPGSIFYKPYSCNFRVRLHSNVIYSTYCVVR